MLKKLTVLLCVFFALPRAWPGEPPGRWVTLPAGGFLTVIGVSGRWLSPDSEIASARNDAARKALLYRGMQVKTRITEGNMPGADFTAETSLEPSSPGDLPALREALRFDPEQDVWRTDNAVFVRFTCPAPGAEHPDYSPGGVVISGEPEWTRRLPDIPGYDVAVGHAGSHYNIRETAVKSYEDAASGIMLFRSAWVEDMYQEDSEGTYYYMTAATAEGELQGFVVLEMWIDPKTRAVWTLAAARKTP